MEESMNGKVNTESMSFHKTVEDVFALPKQDIRNATPLTLAFVGDNVYDLVVRTALYENGNRNLDSMHKKKSSIVKASAQAWVADYLLNNGLFTEEEAEYYRKGKNAKSLSHAKNSNLSDYHKATGLECVMGYLYLTEREHRAVELCKLGIDAYMVVSGNSK